MPKIHASAIVSKESVLADDVEIGPSCILEGKVTLGAGVRLISHVNLFGPIEIGGGTIVHPGACLGFPGQDFKFKPGMPTTGVKIGSGCIIREHVTVHAATKPERPTLIGDRVFMMVNSHAGHDAWVHDDVVLVNGSLLAGHSEVESKAIISGNVAVHQFNRVGRFAMISGGSVISLDAPPFGIITGRNILRGVNVIGMRRNGYSAKDINAVRRAFREYLIKPCLREESLAGLRAGAAECPALEEIAVFIEKSKRGMARGTRSLMDHPEVGE
ncbi:MAG: acyl-ACP--UDP-N-acetylglucosamine O-acyltransferase [Planctomycetes bacterium]|nr:acyl-ACP--UDP-N-acetylglucosamine O-acyltransferase [Planctomycetota bacterium]